MPGQPDRKNAIREERRRQIRGLTLLALAVLLFAALRAGFGQVFTTGWWRLW